MQNSSNSSGSQNAVQGAIRELIGQLNSHFNNAEMQSGHSSAVGGQATPAGGRSVVPSATSGNNLAIQEHRRLFTRQSRIQPYRGRSRTNGRAARDKTTTKTMFCLAKKDQSTTPSTAEKVQLHQHGLGEKRVAFPASASSTAVKEILYQSYPPLKNAGGFQLLLSKETSRKELHVVSHGSCDAQQLRCFGTGRIYVRPLQISIPLAVGVDTSLQHEECLTCHLSIPVSEMRQHCEDSYGSNRVDEQDSNEENYTVHDSHLDMEEGDITVVPLERSSDLNQQNEHSSAEVVPSTSATDVFEANEQPEVVIIDQPAVVEQRSNDAVAGREQDYQDQFRDLETIPFTEHRQRALEDTIMEIGDCNDPVTILRVLSRNFMRGHPLDPVDESTFIEGRTTEIFVSHLNIYEDAMDEILSEQGTGTCDRSFPLEVMFTGENARDFGGPRREFLSEMLRCIKENLCVENKEDGEGGYFLHDNVTARTNQFYVGGGIIFGYSLLQGGPLPCFLSEKQLQALFVESTEIKPYEAQFLEGMDTFGLTKLIKRRPELLYLLRKSAVSPPTYPRLAKLFKPTFSEPGTNGRILEEKSYRYFLKYMKEVAAGRRGSITLENILKFTTAGENEPVLGYGVEPRIEFVAAGSAFPTANTCVNKLSLVIGEKLPTDQERMFSIFDLSFVNAHFGLV